MVINKKYFNKIHPINTEYTRKFIAEHNFFTLILYYLVINILIALFIAILLKLTSENSFLNCYIYSIFGLFTQDINIIIINYVSMEGVVLLLVKILSIILPTALLGLIVYKLFIIPNIFIFREKISFFQDDANKNLFAIRFYNGTKLRLSPIEVIIYARIKKYRKSGEPYLENYKIFMQTWPISFPKVPFSIYIPIITHNKEAKIFTIKYKNNEIIVNHETQLFIMISGNISKLDKSFNEEHFMTLENIDFKKFTDIYVNYDEDPSTWKGWKSFNQ